jgi:hypothetical protein
VGCFELEHQKGAKFAQETDNLSALSMFTHRKEVKGSNNRTRTQGEKNPFVLCFSTTYPNRSIKERGDEAACRKQI